MKLDRLLTVPSMTKPYTARSHDAAGSGRGADDFDLGHVKRPAIQP